MSTTDGIRPEEIKQVDEAIIDAIRDGKTLFSAMHIAVARCLPDLAAGSRFENPKAPFWRVVDRRLQVLRRNKLVKYVDRKKGWRVIE